MDVGVVRPALLAPDPTHPFCSASDITPDKLLAVPGMPQDDFGNQEHHQRFSWQTNHLLGWAMDVDSLYCVNGSR